MASKRQQLVMFVFVMLTVFIIIKTVNLYSLTVTTTDWFTTRISTYIKHTAIRIQSYEDKREQLYEGRRNTILQGCTKLNKPIRNHLNATRNIIDALHNIHYCPIPKVGSTFWKRTLTVLTSNGRLQSPYEIKLSGVKRHSWNTLSESMIKSLEQNGDSILFVRDPYARLFSGYENKLYQPNLAFWKGTGRKVVELVRSKTNGSKYGYDVTFPEFIKYVIYTQEHGNRLNGHFKPMNTWCDPCRTHYKYIGHLETFNDDAEYLISKWRRDFNDVTLYIDDLYKEAALDTARGHTMFLFRTQSFVSTVKYPFINVMLRTWRDLQIRGYISKHTEFPYNSDISDVTSEDLLAKIADALALPQNRSAVKLQRTEALIQAYRQVPLDDMEKLREFVLADCKLFGYDDRPAQLFDRTHVTNDAFMYLDGLSSEPYQ